MTAVPIDDRGLPVVARVPTEARPQDEVGRLSARARIELLLDPGSFQELEAMRHPVDPRIVRASFGDGVVAGWGTVAARPLFVFAQDRTVAGGSLGEAGGAKVHRVLDLAIEAGAPVIGIFDGGGARIQEGVHALCSFGGIFLRNTRASGVVPQISLIMGVAAGGAVYSPALTDFVVMVEGTAAMAITGPRVIKQVSGRDVTLEELGGSWVHTTRSGVVHFPARNEHACLGLARRLLGFLPSNNREQPPSIGPRPSRGWPDGTGPPGERGVDGRWSYDAEALITGLVDSSDLLTYAAGWARNVTCGLARLAGRPVGWVANQPRVNGGRLDRSACEKAARFLRTCDAFNIPVVTIVDCPGFTTGPGAEHGGLIRAASALASARAEATVPLITLVVGSAAEDAHLAMGVTQSLSSLRLAWPDADVGAIGGGPVPDLAGPGWHHAATSGLLDRVIGPDETREALIAGLAAFVRMGIGHPPARKHENFPL